MHRDLLWLFISTRCYRMELFDVSGAYWSVTNNIVRYSLPNLPKSLGSFSPCFEQLGRKTWKAVHSSWFHVLDFGATPG